MSAPSATKYPGPLKTFVSYSHEDRSFCEELLKTLVDLTRNNVITIWTDHALVAGTEWDEKIRAELEEAELILFLVSRSSIASEYITRVEFQRALERHKSGQARLVPIIVRKCDWQSLGLPIQALPPGLIPITQYPNADDAWYDVRIGLKRVIDQMTGVQPSPPGSKASTRQARTIPENATKLCDRTQQEGAFVCFYHEMRKMCPGSPQVYVVIEDELDRPEFLVDRLYEIRVAPLAVSTHGERRGSCLRQSVTEYAYGSLPALQFSSMQSVFSSFGLAIPDEPTARYLFEHQPLSLHSHILLDQTFDGEKASSDAKGFVEWFINEFWAGCPQRTEGPVRSDLAAKTQWLIFLLFRFSSLDPQSSNLQHKLLENLKTIFDHNGRANAEAGSFGVPCLLLPQPSPLSASDVAKVLAAFPFNSIAERNRFANAIYEQLRTSGGTPRMDDVVHRLEQLRQDYIRTGTIDI